MKNIIQPLAWSCILSALVAAASGIPLRTCSRSSERRSGKAKMAEKAQFRALNEHFEGIFNAA
ncbi:MAG: hypothetical protein ACQZ2J_23170 [Pseudomonas piscis]|uniref:hypothetical protein n=1 Tax=Pseudomonas piscis TaxID=2614538 RepID=UPI003D269203